MQHEIFPVQLSDYEPDEPSAHLSKIGYDNIGRKYAVKRLEDGNWIPISEWIGYNLSRKLDIATPEFRVVYENDTPHFGSVWEVGKVFTKKTLTTAELIEKLSGIYQQSFDIVLLDEIIDNPDRHFGNFIFREVTPFVMSFDFSCLQLLHSACGIHQGLCKNMTSNTKKFLRVLAIREKESVSDVSFSKKIIKVTDKDIEKILSSAPSEWLDSSCYSCIISFIQNQITQRYATD